MCRTVVPDPTAKKYDRGAGDHPAVTPPAQKPPISASTGRRRVARTGSATSSNPPSILGITHSGWRESLAGRRKVIAAAGADSSRDDFGRPALTNDELHVDPHAVVDTSNSWVGTAREESAGAAMMSGPEYAERNLVGSRCSRLVDSAKQEAPATAPVQSPAGFPYARPLEVQFAACLRVAPS